MKKLVTIIIIAHKPNITNTEIASLKQCHKVLSNYPITVICPFGLNIAAYKDIVPNINIVFIEPKWQKTYKMFNDLKKSNLLLKMFKQYQYILFYELDAWVFDDRLNYWCSKSFDYIGAPWFDGWHLASLNSNIIGVGNGGFSLRNVKKSNSILQRVKFLKIVYFMWSKSIMFRIVKFEKIILPFRKIFKIKDVSLLNNVFYNDNINEDVFWTQIVTSVFSDFEIASIEEATKFSFEINPSLLFKKNVNELPFGCHAWEKYEPEFWKSFICTTK